MMVTDSVGTACSDLVALVAAIVFINSLVNYDMLNTSLETVSNDLCEEVDYGYKIHFYNCLPTYV